MIYKYCINERGTKKRKKILGEKQVLNIRFNNRCETNQMDCPANKNG
jgi:hypothetical protein